MAFASTPDIMQFHFPEWQWHVTAKTCEVRRTTVLANCVYKHFEATVHCTRHKVQRSRGCQVAVSRHLYHRKETGLSGDTRHSSAPVAQERNRAVRWHAPLKGRQSAPGTSNAHLPPTFLKRGPHASPEGPDRKKGFFLLTQGHSTYALSQRNQTDTETPLSSKVRDHSCQQHIVRNMAFVDRESLGHKKYKKEATVHDFGRCRRAPSAQPLACRGGPRCSFFVQASRLKLCWKAPSLVHRGGSRCS